LSRIGPKRVVHCLDPQEKSQFCVCSASNQCPTVSKSTKRASRASSSSRLGSSSSGSRSGKATQSGGSRPLTATSLACVTVCRKHKVQSVPVKFLFQFAVPSTPLPKPGLILCTCSDIRRQRGRERKFLDLFWDPMHPRRRRSMARSWVHRLLSEIFLRKSLFSGMAPDSRLGTPFSIVSTHNLGEKKIGRAPKTFFFLTLFECLEKLDRCLAFTAKNEPRHPKSWLRLDLGQIRGGSGDCGCGWRRFTSPRVAARSSTPGARLAVD
jgi:hypothetical protein